LLSLSGCGNDDSLTEYKEKMEHFFDQMSYYNGVINAINPHDESAVSDFLGYLDSLQATINEMATYEVPEEFHGVEELADQADFHMTEAVVSYHEAYAAEIYDEFIGESAKESYERANLRIRYIAEILRGDIPEGIFTEE
jgi:hypothetical protein